jgi:L-lactate dehydrogenase complex protein LldG
MSEPRNRPAARVDQGEVLASVRRALGHAVTSRPEPLEPFDEPSEPADTESLVARFSTELSNVVGNVYRLVSDKLQFGEELAAGVADICQAAGVTRLAFSGSSLLTDLDLANRLTLRGLSVLQTGASGAAKPATVAHDELVAQLADCGAGVTAVDYAIAETGTIVLSSDESNALLVSLLPAIHIALLRPSQISASLAEVVSKLNRERVGQGQSCRSASFITGPSRTSDVELTLSIGVHGPKELHVIIIDD